MVIAYVFGAPVGTLIATSGVFAIILGLAMQSALGDVFSGIALNIGRPYASGDWLVLAAARAREKTQEGQRLYAQRQGVEGTISQAVRAFGLRRARYRGLAKTGLQHLATAAALNLDRLAAWLAGRPLAPTRVSRFAALLA